MTPQEREIMQMALDVLDDINQCSLPPTGIPLPAEIDEAMDSLRAALAQPPCATGAQCVGGKCERCAVQPEQEPVAWIYKGNLHPFDPSDWAEEPVRPLYTAPREWVGLTDEEMFNLWVKCPAETEDRFAFARAIEAKLREKNA